MKIKTVDQFIDEIRTQYPPLTKINEDFSKLKKTKFNKNECLFVWDARSGSILFAKGFKNLLGIDDDTINLNSFTALFHENDAEIVFRIGQAAVQYSLKYPKSNPSHNLFISHRIKNSKGDFIKILVHTKPYEIDKTGLITKFLVIFTDISFVDTSNVVQYKFTAKGLDPKSFHDTIFELNSSLFTSREKAVIKELENGHSSNEIADILKISVHTVATHRKKILKKSQCHSTEELLLFCKKNGILTD